MNCLKNNPRVILLCLFSISLYSYDLVSDIVLAVAYSREGNHTLEFGLTTGYVVAPTILCNAVCFYFIHLELESNSWNRYAVLQLILTFPFLLGPLVRHVKTLLRACQDRRTEKVQTHTAIVILLEGYFESASQLILQLYLSITQEEEDIDLSTKILRYAAMVGSSLGLAWSLVSVRRTNRLADDDDSNDETICGSFVYFLAMLAEVGPRIVLMALFAANFTFYAFILGAIHWAVCSVWTFIVDKTPERNQPFNIFLKVLLGYPMIFCFVDLDYVYTESEREHIPTRYKMAVYYIVFYVENWTMFGFWMHKTSNRSKWFFSAAIVSVAIGMILHFIFLAIYYKCCHPKAKEISVFIPLEKKSCLYSQGEDT